MNLILVEPLGGHIALVIDDLTIADIQRINGSHIGLIQPEIKDSHVLLHPLRIDCFRDGDDIMLHVPPQHDLSDRAIIFRRNLDQFRMMENITLPFIERSPGLQLTWLHR